MPRLLRGKGARGLTFLLETSTIVGKLLSYHVEVFDTGFAQIADDLLEAGDVLISLFRRLALVAPVAHLCEDFVVCLR